MKAIIFLIICLTIFGCLSLGAWLVLEGHPCFGLLVMIIGASISYVERKTN